QSEITGEDWGFRLEIHESELAWHLKQGARLFSLIALRGSGQGTVMGRFELRKSGLENRPLINSDAFSGELRENRLLICTGKDAKASNYEVVQNSDQYVGNLDELLQKDGFLSRINGWIMNRISGELPDAFCVCVDGSVVLVHYARSPREDVAESLGSK